MNRSLADARSRVLALGTVAELRAVLDNVYEETAIRHLAAQRLGQHGDAGRVALQEALAAAKENPPGRVAALQALVRYFPKESETTLLEALDDPWPRVKQSARLLLKRFANQLAPEVRLAACLPAEQRSHLSFEGLNWQAQERLLCAIRQAYYTPALPQLVARLQRFTRTGTWESIFHQSMLEKTIQIFNAEAVPYLRDAIPKSYPVNQEFLLSVLVQISSPEADATLRTLHLPLNPRALERARVLRRSKAQLRNKRGQRRAEYHAYQRQHSASAID